MPHAGGRAGGKCSSGTRGNERGEGEGQRGVTRHTVGARDAWNGVSHSTTTVFRMRRNQLFHSLFHLAWHRPFHRSRDMVLVLLPHAQEGQDDARVSGCVCGDELWVGQWTAGKDWTVRSLCQSLGAMGKCSAFCLAHGSGAGTLAQPCLLYCSWAAHGSGALSLLAQTLDNTNRQIAAASRQQTKAARGPH